MGQVAQPLYAICLTLWVGGLWAIGGIAAPTLFGTLGDRALAGAVAGRLFSAIALVGFACGGYMLAYQVATRGARALKTGVFWVVTVMLLLTAAAYFGVSPLLAQLKAQALPRDVVESVVRSRFAAWHGVSSVLYLIQCALGGVLVVLEQRAAGRGK